MRSPWCLVLSVMHYPAERVWTLLLLSWPGQCGCAASAPLHRGILWLGFCFSWAQHNMARDAELGKGNTVVEFVY